MWRVLTKVRRAGRMCVGRVICRALVDLGQWPLGRRRRHGGTRLRFVHVRHRDNDDDAGLTQPVKTE